MKKNILFAIILIALFFLGMLSGNNSRSRVRAVEYQIQNIESRVKNLESTMELGVGVPDLGMRPLFGENSKDLQSQIEDLRSQILSLQRSAR
jgi:peptidoglycan hydrolase CwlO-like protein